MPEPNQPSHPDYYKPKKFQPYPLPERKKAARRVEIRFRDQTGNYRMAFDFESARLGGGGAKRIE